MSKKLITIAMIAMLLITAVMPAYAQEATAQAMQVGTIVPAGATVYDNPYQSGQQAGRLAGGTEVIILQRNVDWVQVSSRVNRLVGWVSAAELVSNNNNGTSPVYLAVVISQSISLRTEPNVRSERIKSLSNGDILEIIGDQGGWLQINIWDNNQYIQGWVRSDFVVVNPRFVTTHQATYVYALPEHSSKKVGELISGTQLVVIAEYGDYWVVNLRSASGFIAKSDILYIQ